MMPVILMAHLWPGVHNRADKCFENKIHEVSNLVSTQVPPKSTCVNHYTSKASEMLRAPVSSEQNRDRP